MNNQDKQTIHIAYALDDNYTEITCVSMASLLYNTKSQIHFYILESNLSEDNKTKLSSLKDRFPHGKWKFVPVKHIGEQALNAGSMYLTEETYYRLLLPELFPKIDKMIYLDGDTVIEGDIVKLWETDIDDDYIGAVPYKTAYQEGKQKLLGLYENELYFNAGILLFNLQKLREFNLYNKAKKVTQRLYEEFCNNGYFWCADQEVLNYLFRGNYLMLPAKYNVLMIYYTYGYRGIDLSDVSEAFRNPFVIHYAGERKPDKITKKPMYHPLWERYYKYKAMTSYADTEGDNQKIEIYKQHEAQMDNTLIVSTDKYIQYKRHLLFSELADKLPLMDKGKKIALWGAGMDIEYIVAMLAAKDVHVEMIVDGLPENQGKKIFHYSVKNPDELQGLSNDYFVLLCMRKEKAAASAINVLHSYGFDENDCYHVFMPLWENINRLDDIYNAG